MNQPSMLMPEKKKLGRPCKPSLLAKSWAELQEATQINRDATLTLTLKLGEVEAIKSLAIDRGMTTESYVMSKIDLKKTKCYFSEYHERVATRHYGQTYVSHTL